MYMLFKIAGNRIGDKGCEHLCSGAWKNLNILDLCKSSN